MIQVVIAVYRVRDMEYIYIMKNNDLLNYIRHCTHFPNIKSHSGSRSTRLNWNSILIIMPALA